MFSFHFQQSTYDNVADSENSNEINNQTEMKNIGEQANAEPCKELPECVPSGLKDTKGDESEYPQQKLTETITEEVEHNVANLLPAKLQSLDSQSLGSGIACSFI